MNTTDPNGGKWGMLLGFDSDSDDFARGFEAGRLWGILRSTDEPLDATVHASNAEMLLRIAEATGRAVQAEDVDDGWVEAHFGEPVHGD